MKCTECESNFQPKTTKQIFCNKKCSYQYHNKNRKKYNKECQKCNIAFESRHKKQIYCSLNCSNKKFDIEKYKEMGKKSAAKRYQGKILLKDTIRICEWCKQEYNPRRSEQKLCDKKCSILYLVSDKEKLKINGRKGFDKRQTHNRSKNEILFSELCIRYFGINDIQCNEQIFKDKNNGMWDCDIYIKSLKTAILYDGWYWHYGPNVSNRQKARDMLKRKIILDNGSKYYTIIDKGKFDKVFVEEQFNLFIHKLHFKNVLDQLKLKN